MSTNGYHPDCACQQKPLNDADLKAMHAAGKYDEINEAWAAGRFQFDTDQQ